MAKKPLATLLGLTLILLVACGQAAAPTATQPANATPTVGVSQTSQPTSALAAQPTPTAVSASSEIVSARDNITLVIDQEPSMMNPLPSTGSSQSTNAVSRDNLVDPLVWAAGDDQRIVATTATTGWEQLAPDTWRFHLRQGVKFHNDEPWNAQAALPSLEFQGQASNGSTSQAYTGNYTAKLVDDYTVDIVCEQGCPIFLNTAFYLTFVAPNFLATAAEAQQTRTTVGFGPYKMVSWDPGVSITEEAYDGYVPAGNEYEFQKPYIKNLTWFWRGESTVMAAMIKSGEADMAWDAGVDASQSLPKNMVKSGSTGEVWSILIDTVWNPELKKVKVRQAMAHAINCQEMIDSLYGGLPTCRGNITYPGVIGATAENTNPYTFDPDLSRQLLKEANYNLNTTFTYISRPNRIPKQTEINEAIQGYLKDVGVNIDIKTVDPTVRNEYKKCRVGTKVNEILTDSGRTPGKDQPTFDDFRAALTSPPTSCATADLMENSSDSLTLDFGRTLLVTLNCESLISPNCDPSPGGFQEMMPKALAATGEERQQLMQAIADRVHNEALAFAEFDLAYFYAVNPKLNWEPRFDGRVRANTMWFSP